jgi:TRAP-type C4-dicarboxylate transport system substrate-binding protein
MLRKNRILCILLALSMILAMMTGCTQNSNKEETSKESESANEKSDYSYHWKLATTEPQDYYMVQLSQKFIDEVNKRTGGKVTGEVFASGQLGNLVGALEGLDMGNVDIVMDGISSLSEVNEMFNVFGIAYLYDSKIHIFFFNYKRW